MILAQFDNSLTVYKRLLLLLGSVEFAEILSEINLITISELDQSIYKNTMLIHWKLKKATNIFDQLANILWL